MLDPETRHLLTDALRPPENHVVDVAVVTTYTVDLSSVLLAPLAMAAYDRASTADPMVEDDAAATPLALLESVRRHAAHTTVFCQAGGVHVPSTFPRLAAFAEGMLAEVLPPTGRTFHPKFWVLRFRDAAEADRLRHRFVCLSRNLTGDRSWDTVLVCDEDALAAHTLAAAPVADLLRDVVGSTARPLDPARQEQIRDLCATLAGVRLALPAGFTSGRVVTLGTPSGQEWPLPETADRWAVVSPFLDAGALARLPKTGGRRVLISRPDTLTSVGARACHGMDTRVLLPLAEGDALDEEEPEAEHSRPGPPPRGLHAKVFAWEAGGQGHVLTGSANCTTAAFDGNVELSVLLTGPSSTCGVTQVLGDDDTGLLALTQGHEVVHAEGTDDPYYAAERRLEAFHVELARQRPRLVVTENEDEDDDGYELRLQMEFPEGMDELTAATTVRPVGVKHASWHPLLDAPSWRGLSLLGLTPYLAVSTTAPVEGADVAEGEVARRECVLVCEVQGCPDDRLSRLLRDLLSRQEDVLRYLALLLGDPTVDDLMSRLLAVDDAADADGSPAAPGGSTLDDLVLLEPLVRAAARDDDSLQRAHRLLEDLRTDGGELPVLTPEFVELWDVVWGSRT